MGDWATDERCRTIREIAELSHAGTGILALRLEAALEPLVPGHAVTRQTQGLAKGVGGRANADDFPFARTQGNYT